LRRCAKASAALSIFIGAFLAAFVITPLWEGVLALVAAVGADRLLSQSIENVGRGVAR
jgi:hypothetical protein